MKPFAFITLLLLLATTTPSTNAKYQDSEIGMKEGEPHNASPTEPKAVVFPNQLDISTLHNMPLVILHPRIPINLQMLPGENMATLHKSLSPNKILELLQSATFSLPAKVPPPQGHEENNRQARDRNFANSNPQASENQPQSVHHSNSQSDSLALPRSLSGHPGNNGWFQRFRGSFSNMFPSIRPLKENPFQFGLPTMNLPVFIPHHQPQMQASFSPFVLGSNQQFQILPWNNFHHIPSLLHGGDSATGASHAQPTRMLFGNSRFQNPFRPPPMTHHPFGGGDLATSGSSFVPHRVRLPAGPHHFAGFNPPAPLQRHKPLFNNVDGIHAASLEISNAFADFTDSKDHGPEVTQRFGSVGHSINNFLKMMGLGATDSFSMSDVGGFGGGSDMASLDSTPIARSMDFYPGYGNQAHLDDIEDFPIFHEDITDEFMKKMNITNDKKESTDIKEAEKEDYKKENISPHKHKLEMTEKSKTPLRKGSKDSKQANTKSTFTSEKNQSYVAAVPVEKANTEKSESKPTEQPEVYTASPIVGYKVPPTHSTVAPRDRKQPVAIYQHFSSNSNKDSPKPPEYAPAQAMPQQEAEANPNKLVDDDEVRQWRLVNNGLGYVEKRPVPNVDVLHASMSPESLKILQKVLSGGAKGTV